MKVNSRVIKSMQNSFASEPSPAAADYAFPLLSSTFAELQTSSTEDLKYQFAPVVQKMTCELE